MLGYNGFIQETEDAAALALGRNGFIQPVEEQGAPPAASVVPASFVVASDREDYPLTEAGLLAAIAALPAGGGDIYVGAGDIAITAGAIAITKPIRIFGAGVGVTTFTLGAGIKLFSVGAVYATFQDFTVLGDNSTEQYFITFTAASLGTWTNVVRVNCNGGPTSVASSVRRAFEFGSFARRVNVRDCYFGLQALSTSRLFADATGSTIVMENVFCPIASLVTGTPTVTMTNCVLSMSGLDATFGTCVMNGCNIGNSGALTFSQIIGAGNTISATTLNVGANTQIASSFLTAAVVATGSGIKISNSTVSNFTSAVAGRDGHHLKGCTFTVPDVFGTTITLTDSDNCVITGNIGAVVAETASSDSNIFSDNLGFLISGIVGPNDIVDGTRRFGGTGNTADAYAVLFTFTSLKGLFGIGTIKNTDGAADEMTVEEQAIDFFGTTHTKETVVSAGDDYMLDLQTNFAAAGGPPYSNYRVRVKSTSAGNPAPYSVQFAAQGIAT